MIEQGTNEWHLMRLGKVTGSRVAELMAKTKSGEAASRKNYMMELLCQRLTGRREESFSSAAMQRGADLEPIARSFYEAANNVMVEESSFVFHPVIKAFGASPDGFVGDDGLIEIKCPNTAQHIDFITTKKPDGKYIWQMQAQMACTGRKWCDFVSFDDRLPERLQFDSVRIWRDDEKIAEMEAEIVKFLDELDALECKFKEDTK
jgi:putative phage-type endonuclease